MPAAEDQPMPRVNEFDLRRQAEFAASELLAECRGEVATLDWVDPDMREQCLHILITMAWVRGHVAGFNDGTGAIMDETWALLRELGGK